MDMDKRRTDTKQRIMKTAIELFAGKGFDATSIRDIVKAVGITTGSFYNHFPGKGDLLEEMYTYYEKTIITPVEQNINMEEMLETMGVIPFFHFLIEKMYHIEMQTDLVKLSRIIAMEQFKNKTAAKIAFEARKRNQRFMEQLFILMNRKELIQIEDPHLSAQALGYMLSGISQDYYYYNHLKDADTDVIMEKQKSMVTWFFTTFVKEK